MANVLGLQTNNPYGSLGRPVDLLVVSGDKATCYLTQWHTHGSAAGMSKSACLQPATSLHMCVNVP